MKSLFSFQRAKTELTSFIAMLVIVTSFTACKKTSTTTTNSTPATVLYYSTWQPASWTQQVYTDEYGATDTAYNFSLTAANLTQNAIDSGAVLVYVKYTARPNSVYSLPYMDPLSALSFWYTEQPGSIAINYAFGPALGGYDPGAYNAGDISVRYVILSGGTAAGGLTTTGNTNTGGSTTRVATTAGFPSSLDKNIYQQMSYDQLCQLHGIPK
jgi:hypothetical protein